MCMIMRIKEKYKTELNSNKSHHSDLNKTVGGCGENTGFSQITQ